MAYETEPIERLMSLGIATTEMFRALNGFA